MKTETTRDAAAKVAMNAIDNSAMESVLARVNFEVLVNAIEAALNAERERAAKIAESMAAGETYGTGRQKAINIAAAIRGKD